MGSESDRPHRGWGGGRAPPLRRGCWKEYIHPSPPSPAADTGPADIVAQGEDGNKCPLPRGVGRGRLGSGIGKLAVPIPLKLW